MLAEFTAALLTALFAALLLFVWGQGHRRRAKRTAGPLLLRLMRPHARAWQAAMLVFAGLIAAYGVVNIRSFTRIDPFFAWQTPGVAAFFLFGVLCFLLFARQSGFGIQLREHGIVPDVRLRIAFAPWAYVEYCEWTCPLGTLLVQYRGHRRKYRIARRQIAEATEVLSRYVEVRDVTGKKTDEPRAPRTPRPEQADATGAPEPILHRWQFNLRTLLLFMLAASCAFSWHGIRVRREREQRAVIEELQRRGCKPDALWFDTDVYRLDFRAPSKVADDDLKGLEKLTRLRMLGLTDCPVTDAGLVHLKGLRNLEYLNLEGTAVTKRGVQNLHRALPETEILY